MKDRLQKLLHACYALLPAVALFCAEHSVSATCALWMYQPDVPAELLEEQA